MDPTEEGPYEAPQTRSSVGRMVGITLAVAAVLVLVWHLYDRMVLSGGGTPARLPLIEADEGPTKQRPEDPGGLVIPNQDKLVYEALDGAGAEETVERLLPPPEEPLPQPEPTPEPVVDVQPLAPVPETAEPSSVPELPPAELPDAPATVQAVVVPPPPEPPPPEPEPTPEAAPEPEPAAATGAYLVQIASFRKIDDADTAWRRMVKKHGDLLSTYTARVERADLGAELGVFYRLRLGPMADETTAKTLCAMLKARDIDCLIVRP
ncbi:MAG: SPOR domain-containing protein [Alphaproteobacteria bacterium]